MIERETERKYFSQMLDPCYFQTCCNVYSVYYPMIWFVLFQSTSKIYNYFVCYFKELGWECVTHLL
jgi:hypothetical protein